MRRSTALLSVPCFLISLAGCGQVPTLGPDADPPMREHAFAPPISVPDGMATELAPPTRWLGVAGSPGDASVLAAWTKTDIVLTHDAGKTYETVLAGKGDVDNVAIDEHGAVTAIRHHRNVGVLGVDGVVFWRAIPHVTRTLALKTAAGILTWYGVSRTKDGSLVEAIAFSRDDGASWTFPDEPRLGNFANQVTVEQDGTVRIMAASEADCGGGYQALYEGKAGGSDWKQIDWTLDTPTGFGIGSGGWAYGIGDCGADPTDPQRLCGKGPAGDAVEVQPMVHAHALAIVTGAGRTWATVDGRLASLHEGRVTFPAKSTPHGFRITGTDADGQPLGVADGLPLRWTRSSHWQALFGAPAA